MIFQSLKHSKSLNTQGTGVYAWSLKTVLLLQMLLVRFGKLCVKFALWTLKVICVNGDRTFIRVLLFLALGQHFDGIVVAVAKEIKESLLVDDTSLAGVSLTESLRLSSKSRDICFLGVLSSFLGEALMISISVLVLAPFTKLGGKAAMDLLRWRRVVFFFGTLTAFLSLSCVDGSSISATLVFLAGCSCILSTVSRTFSISAALDMNVEVQTKHILMGKDDGIWNGMGWFRWREGKSECRHFQLTLLWVMVSSTSVIFLPRNTFWPEKTLLDPWLVPQWSHRTSFCTLVIFSLSFPAKTKTEIKQRAHVFFFFAGLQLPNTASYVNQLQCCQTESPKYTT